MTSEKEAVKTESGLGTLGGCLVEGNAEDKVRGKKSKRRAIAISVTLQTVGLTALVIAPLLAKPAELAVRNVVPIPPYSHAPAQHRATTQIRTQHRTGYNFVNPPPISQIVSHIEREASNSIEEPQIPGTSVGLEPSNGLSIADTRVQPPPPPPQTKKRIHETSIDPALLVRRVEPLYPALARQIHRTGKVELHAIIATDGSIQSLEVVSGDPLFVQSALDAVRQWHYRPTYLSGQPVEVDTFITVIYSMPQ